MCAVVTITNILYFVIFCFLRFVQINS